MGGLSSILVRDQVLSVVQVEKVLQRQVIFGGDFSTNVLELGILEEPLLASYLGQALDMPVLDPAHYYGIANSQRAILSKDTAVRYRVIPVERTAQHLVVAAADPLTPAVREKLTALIGLPVDTKLVLEFRLAMLLYICYGETPTARMMSIAKKRDPRSLEAATATLRRTDDNAPADSDDTSPADDAIASSPERIDHTAQLFTEPQRVTVESQRSATIPSDEVTRQGLRLNRPKRRFKLISYSEARDLLKDASNRDEIVDIFFRFCHQAFEFSLLCVASGDSASGKIAVLRGEEAWPAESVLVPLHQGGIFETAATSLAPQVGSMDHPVSIDVLSQLGRDVPLNAAVIPVVLRDRLIMLLYGDSGNAGIKAKRVEKIHEFTGYVSQAFERLLLQRKFAAYTESQPSPSAPTSPDPTRDAAPPNAVKEAIRFKSEKDSSSEEGPLPSRSHTAKRDLSGWAVPVTLGKPSDTDKTPRDTDEDSPSTDTVKAVAIKAISPRNISSGRATWSGERPDDIETPATPLANPRSETTVHEADAPSPDAVSHTADSSRQRPSSAPDPQEEAENLALYQKRQSILPGTAGVYIQVPGKEPPTANDNRHPDREDDMLGDTLYLNALTPSPTNPDEAPIPLMDAPRQTHAYGTFDTDPPRSPRESGRTDSDTEHAPIPLHSSDDAHTPDDDTTRSMQRIVDALAAGKYDAPSVAWLVAQGDSAAGMLVTRFPGPLMCDRFQEMGKLSDVASHGPVLRAFVQFGQTGIPYLLPLLDSFDSEIRFYAMFLLSTLATDNALPRIAPKVFDSDRQIRSLAMTTLRRFYGTPGYRVAVRSIADVLGGIQTPLEKKRLAADILSELTDPAAIDILIDLLGSVDRVLAERAHDALVATTFCDHGFKERSWRQWWDQNRKGNPVLWAVDALNHQREHIRRMAIDALKERTGSHIEWPRPPYDSNQRNALRSRVLEWWHQSGYQLFET